MNKVAMIRSRFSLKSSLILATMICVGMGFRSCSVNRQTSALGRMRAEGRAFMSDHSLDYPGPNFVWTNVNSWFALDPLWPQYFLGQWGCLDIYGKIVVYRSELNDEVIKDILCLYGLKSLTLFGGSDAGFQPISLSQLENVEFLSLGGDWVTVEHISAIANLSNLNTLTLVDVQLDEHDIEQLRDDLPNTKIQIGSIEELLKSTAEFELGPVR